MLDIIDQTPVSWNEEIRRENYILNKEIWRHELDLQIDTKISFKSSMENENHCSHILFSLIWILGRNKRNREIPSLYTLYYSML